MFIFLRGRPNRRQTVVADLAAFMGVPTLITGKGQGAGFWVISRIRQQLSGRLLGWGCFILRTVIYQIYLTVVCFVEIFEKGDARSKAAFYFVAAVFDLLPLCRQTLMHTNQPTGRGENRPSRLRK